MYLIKGHINSLLRPFHFFFTASILLNMLQLCLFIEKINLKYRNTKVCKLAKWWRHTLNQILIIYDEQRYLGQFSSEMFDVWFLCSKNLLCVLHNMDLTVLLSWQHTGFRMLMIFEVNLLASRNWVGGDWKRVSCKDSRFFNSCRCVSCRAISLPSFNGLRCKLAR